MGLGDINPIENPEAWDVVEIGQVESPGRCEVTGFKRGNEWDIKKGKGSVGATATYVQKPPAKGSIKFFLWTVEHYYQWDDFLPLLKYDPTRRVVQAVDIWHPALAAIDVNSVVVENIGQPEKEETGQYSINVEMIEYFPAPKASAVGTPNGSVSTQKGTTPGTPVDPVADAQQAEIAALLKQATAP